MNQSFKGKGIPMADHRMFFKVKIFFLTVMVCLWMPHSSFAEDFVSGLTPLPTSLNAPSNLAAIAKSSTKITISWKDNCVNRNGV
jgi:hypothetical protein